MKILIGLTIYMVIYGWTKMAGGHDHQKQDLDKWYRSLTVPKPHGPFHRGQSCCDVTDCAPGKIRWTKEGLEAQAGNGVWLPVHPHAIIKDKGNPYKFQPVVCIRMGKVNCLVMGEAGF